MLFGVMVIVWGEKWSRAVDAPDTPTHKMALGEWSRATADLSNEQFVNGLQKAKMILDYPPSIAQFRRMSIGLLEPQEAYDFILKWQNEVHRNSFTGAVQCKKYTEKLESRDLRFITLLRAFRNCAYAFGRYSDYNAENQRLCFFTAYKTEVGNLLLGIAQYLEKEDEQK